MPRGSGGQPVLLEQDDVGPAEVGQVISDAAAGDAAADDDHMGTARQGSGHAYFPVIKVTGLAAVARLPRVIHGSRSRETDIDRHHDLAAMVALQFKRVAESGCWYENSN